MKVLMVGVDKQTKGGMWTVVKNYLDDLDFCEKSGLKYISTAITGSKMKRVMFTACALSKILFELLTGHYDIVHIHMAEKGSVYRKSIIAFFARLFRCKVLLHMHGAEFEKWYKKSSIIQQAYVRRILQKADRIIILGEYWKPFINSLTNGKTQVQVVYNAVKVPISKHYNLKAHNMLFLGAVIKRKGIYDLLEAIKTIDQVLDATVKLWIYGPDVEKNIESIINKMGLEKRVFYKGYMEEAEKKKVFQYIALNILPSWNEGLPMTILETMAEGIPNISTNVAAIPEAVDNENGIIIRPGDIGKLADSILTLIQDDKKREIKSCFAYEKVKEKFSLSCHLSKIIQIYRELEREK